MALMTQVVKSYEPMQTLTNQGLYGNDNKNVQIGYMKSIEPQIFDKKQEVTLKNATSLQIGETNAMNLELFLAPDYYSATMERYEEIKRSGSIIAYC